MAEIRITADVQEAIDVLNEFGSNQKANQKYILTALGREGAKISRKAYTRVGLKKGNEQILYRSISSWASRKGDKVYIGPKRKKNTTELIKAGKGLYKNDISYGYILAHGFESNPKNYVTKWNRKKSGTVIGTKYMKFLSDGRWVTMHKGFRVKEYDFVEGPIRRWMDGPLLREKLDLLIERRIRGVEKKVRARRVTVQKPKITDTETMDLIHSSLSWMNDRADSMGDL